MNKQYVLVQVGCPECKTKTDILGYFDDLDKATRAFNAYQRELAKFPKKVEYQVFELPPLNFVDEYYRNK